MPQRGDFKGGAELQDGEAGRKLLYASISLSKSLRTALLISIQSSNGFSNFRRSLHFHVSALVASATDVVSAACPFAICTARYLSV